MDFLMMLGGALWTFASYALPFLFVLGIVIFIHELGHYLAGRWCGVGIEAFAIGFGKRLFGWSDRHGTDWKVCAIPLGGYVKFSGDLNAASMPDAEGGAMMSAEERGRALQFKPLWQRATIVAAGPIANFLLAMVIFSSVFMFSGRSTLEPVVGGVEPGSVADSAGFMAGDRIVAIDGNKILSFDDLRAAVTGSADLAISIDYLRDGKLHTVSATPRFTEHKTPFGRVQLRTLGLQGSQDPAHFHMDKAGPGEAIVLAAKQSVFVITSSVSYVSGLIAGREKADQLSGPIRIAQVSGKVAEAGIVSLLMLVAILSVNIGFVNLLPIPILDGGHLLFFAIEGVFRRAVSQRAMEYCYRVGFCMILSLMAFTFVNDLIQIGRG